MKQITCFTESLCGGGAEHQMALLAGMLAEKEYNVTIVTYASLPDHYKTPKRVTRIDIGKTRINNRIIKALVKAIKTFHYFLWLRTDCIIAYRECANLRVLLPMFFRSRRKVKVICSDRNASTYLSFQHKLLLNILYKRADYIVPNSSTEAQFITAHKPKLLTKLRTIHNYTDLQLFTMTEMPKDVSIIKIAIFSRFSAQKNPLGFADAVKVLKEHTNKPFEVHWYGGQKGNNNEPSSDYLNFKKKIIELGIDDVLILHPAIKNPAIEMGHYHAICLPSLYEGFSNSVAEGICCGKPMLVSDVSDNSIMVHDGENGYLFNPQDSNSICDAFRKFFTLSFEEMSSMANASRKIAESLFNKDYFIQQYIDIIEK